MEPTTTTAPATHETPDFSHLIEEALDAFWDVVSDHFPLAETGDLSAASVASLETAAQRAIEEWVKANAPSAA